VKDGSIVGDSTAVRDLSEVLSEQARPEIRQRKHCGYWSTRNGKRIFPPIEATGPSELEEVFREGFLHPLKVETRLLAP
jgi:hypothetical protein